MKTLDVKARLVYKYLELYIAQHGKPPTPMQIGRATRINKSSIFNRLTILEARGYIRRRAAKTRTITLTDKSLAA